MTQISQIKKVKYTQFDANDYFRIHNSIRMKNKYSKNLIFLFSIAIAFTSCRARFYTPNRNPIPLFKKSGDVYLDLSSNLTNKIDLTGGYAIAKGVGAYVGYSKAFQSTSNGDSASGSTYRYNGEMLNFGLGYFLNENIDQSFRFEVYSDFAFGTFKNRVSGGNIQYFNGNFKRIGIMPNIGYSSLDNRFNMAYSLRLSNISFSNASISDNAYWRSDIERYQSKGSYQMVEQAMMFRFGSEQAKFQIQLASYHGLNADELVNAVPRWNASVMIGLVLTPQFR